MLLVVVAVGSGSTSTFWRFVQGWGARQDCNNRPALAGSANFGLSAAKAQIMEA